MVVWFIVGLVLGAALILMATWLRSRKIAVTWYEWLIVILGLALLLFTIQDVNESVKALEPTATWMNILIFGLPALILIGLAGNLAWRRHKASS